MPCNSCWARGPNASLPEGQSPGFLPGRDSGDHVCPSDRPFVSGETMSCGCMDAYHNMVCDENRCCRAEYECYGNCGDYTALYVFLCVLFPVLFLCVIGRRCCVKN